MYPGVPVPVSRSRRKDDIPFELYRSCLFTIQPGILVDEGHVPICIPAYLKAVDRGAI